MKKALIISYYWPPSGGSGVQRWMYFAKYLTENGIEPTVITIDPKDAAYPSMDESLLKQIEGIRVIQTTGGFSLLKTYANLKGGKARKQIPVGNFGSTKKTLFDQLAGYVRANFFIPDARVGWNKKVIPIATKLLQDEVYDFLVTTGPPHSTHLIGLELKKKFSINWIADFRDPWREVYYNSLFKRTKRSDLKDALLEKSVLNGADSILTVGPSMKSLLQSKINKNPDKVEAIFNGFDQELFNGIVGKRYTEFTIAHIGIWTTQQAHKEIIEALNTLLSDHKGIQIRFVLVGQVQPEIISKLSQIEGLILDIRGKQAHQIAIQEMMNADILLNCLATIADSKMLVSGKLMEYLASGNHVIAIGDPDGDAAQLMANIPNAEMIEPGNSNSLKNTIFDLMQKERKAPKMSDQLAQYSRKATAHQLANFLKSRTHVS